MYCNDGYFEGEFSLNKRHNSWIYRFRLLCLSGLISILCACTSSVWLSDSQLANTISEPARLQIKTYKAGQFIVHGRERYDNPGSDLNIYLEGDGLAWVSRREPSRDHATS